MTPPSSPLRVAVRTDASIAIGAGHAMRCLTLAEALRAVGAEVCFVCLPASGDALDLIVGRGFRTHALGAAAGWRQDAEHTARALMAQGPLDWIVVDHYGLDARWESRLRTVARRILVIDDLADRDHDCDVLLDQNFYAGAVQRYKGRVPAGCRLFLGPAHVLLRDEFREAMQRPRERNGGVRRVLVSFGATDPTDETGKVLAAMQALSMPALACDVVVGASNPRRERIEAQCAALAAVRCHVQTPHMAELMWAADLAVGAGGATTWERCILGLPTLTVVTSANQLQTTTDLAAAGAVWYLGRAEALAAADYETAIRTALRDPGRLGELSARSRAIMAAAGAASSRGSHPVVAAMLGAGHND
jgi:UDP-2,4-diacetamido-2,4,6-trideoxy-beta-L-altropyranose hydrolase